MDKIFFGGKIVEKDGEDDDEVEYPVVEMSVAMHATLTCLIVATGFTVAYFVNDLQMGECVVVLVLRQADLVDSIVVCWINWLDDDIVHPNGTILLEGVVGYTNCKLVLIVFLAEPRRS